MLDPKASLSFKKRGFIALFATSLVVAVVNLEPPTSRVNWPHLFDQDVGFYLAGIWLLLVAIALVFHGRRGLWLLVGMPVALFFPIYFLLWATGCLDTVLDRLPTGLTNYGFEIVLLVYAGFWILIGAVIAYVVRRSRSLAI
jgi:hypothetical protein